MTSPPPCASDPDAFFNVASVTDIRKAVAICGGCPFKRACLETALSTEEEYGVWGGTTEGERAAWLGSTPPEQMRCLSCGGSDFERLQVPNGRWPQHFFNCRSCGLSHSVSNAFIRGLDARARKEEKALQKAAAAEAHRALVAAIHARKKVKANA